MKQILLFLLFFQCISIFSQDWQIFHSGRTRFYDKGTKALRVDSTFYQNGDSILKFYNCLTTYVGICDTSGPTFIGSQLTIKPNGDQELYFEHFDTLFIPQNIQINDTWTIIQDDSIKISAKLIEIDTVHAFDYVDSVRVIQLYQTQNLIINNTSFRLDSSYLKISKSNGLYSSSMEIFHDDLYQFKIDYITSKDYRPLIKDIYNLSVGDVIGFRNNRYSGGQNFSGHTRYEYQRITTDSNSIELLASTYDVVYAPGGPWGEGCGCDSYKINNINDSLFYSLPNEYPIKITEPSILWRMYRQNNGFTCLKIDKNDGFSYYEINSDEYMFEPLTYSFSFELRKGDYLSLDVDDPTSSYSCGIEFSQQSFGNYGDPYSVPLCRNCVTSITPMSSNSNFSLYPNPSTTSFSIESPSKISKIEIFNLLGSQVFFQNIDNKNFMEINVKELQRGMNVVKVETENGTFSQKWIKE